MPPFCRLLFVAMLFLAPPLAAQTFTLDDAAAIRTPRAAALARDGQRVTWILGDTLWARPLSGGRPSGPPRPVVDGMEALGSTARPFAALAPDGSRLAFLRPTPEGEVAMVADFEDSRVVINALLPDSLAEIQLFAHYAAGGPSWSPNGDRLAFLGAAEGDSGLQVRVVTWPERTVERWTTSGGMRYSVAFSPDGRWLAAAGGGNGTAFVELFDAVGGQETGRRIASWEGRYGHDLLWSPEGDAFLVQTDQYRARVFDVDPDGGVRERPVDLPRARWLAWTASDFVVATRRAGMGRRIFAQPLDGGDMRELIGSMGVQELVGVSAGPGNGSVIMWSRESGDHPRDLWAARLAGPDLASGPAERVTDANPDLEDRLPSTSSVYEWTGADGETHLSAQLFLPKAGAGPWPLVIIPYGGYSAGFPQSEYFLDAGVLPFVARGWAVTRPNTRGRIDDSAPVGRYGAIQLEDTQSLVRALAADGVVDPARIAAIGHSHGGSLAWYFATHASDFCAVAAVNGRTDWRAQVAYGDAFLLNALGGTPGDVPDVYASGSPIENLESVRSPMLAVVGGKDTQILPAPALLAVERLEARGADIQLLHFPDEGHLFRRMEDRKRIWNAFFHLTDRACRNGRH